LLFFVKLAKSISCVSAPSPGRLSKPQNGHFDKMYQILSEYNTKRLSVGRGRVVWSGFRSSISRYEYLPHRASICSPRHKIWAKDPVLGACAGHTLDVGVPRAGALGRGPGRLNPAAKVRRRPGRSGGSGLRGRPPTGIAFRIRVAALCHCGSPATITG
jgi:hypothetical protein